MDQYNHHLHEALLFIHNHQKLVDCHLVDFITKNLWENCLPPALKLQLEHIKDKNINFNEITTSNGELGDFIKQCEAHNLKNISGVLELKDLPTLLPAVNINWQDIIHTNGLQYDFMTEKKSHEISVLTQVIGYLAKAHSSLVIDVGAGKGYLATSLSQNYEIPVLAIDSNESRHESAIRRLKLLQKKKHQSFPLVQHTVKFIDDNTNYKQLVQSAFPDYKGNEKFLLAGLHTCGSLAHAMLKSFLQTECLKSLCVVSCCYHLAEKSLTGHCDLTKNARMLAQQSIERISTKDSDSPTLFYRAVLQILLQSLGIPDAKIGRGAPVNDFPTYVNWALQKIGIKPMNIPTVDLLNELYQTHVASQWKMRVFQSLRVHLGSVIESVIVLDRAIYLQQSQKCSKVTIMRLFDPLLSPRCYAIVAIK